MRGLASGEFFLRDAENPVHRVLEVPGGAWTFLDYRGAFARRHGAVYQDKATVAAINTSLTAAFTTVSSSASASSTSA